MHLEIVEFDTVGSTNEVALEHARKGAAEGVCITARRQTAGRGRHGRTWVSEADAGLYASLILRPQCEPRYFPLLTLMAGVAAADSLSKLGLQPDIKWVNDLLIGEKKIGGILSEATDTPLGTAVIIGIGINLKEASLPPDIANSATSVEQEIGRIVLPDELLDLLMAQIERRYDLLSAEDGPSRIVEEWARRSTYFSDKAVSVVLDNDSFTGVTDGLEKNGALRVKSSSGLRIVQAGDVQSVRAAV